MNSSFPGAGIETVNNIRGLFTGEKTPSKLVHYTAAAGAIGILRNKQLWLSNSRFLNDHTEMESAREIVKQIIDDLFEELEEKRAKGFKSYEPVREFLNSALTYCDLLLKEKEVQIACFCTKSNLLSQWRGYADAGGGFSIEFDTEHLLTEIKDSLPEAKVKLQKVLYDHEEWTQLVRKLFDILTNSVETEYSRLKNPAISRYSDQIAGSVFKQISLSAPLMKHVGFMEEDEWRITAEYRNDFSEFQFRVGKIGIVPYIQANIGDCISRVTIGPRKDQDIAERALELMLMNQLPPIVFSNIPFR